MISYRFQLTFKLRFNLIRLVFALCLSCQNAETSRFAAKKELFYKTFEHTSPSHLPEGQGLGGIDGIKKLGSLGHGEHEEHEECRQHGERRLGKGSGNRSFVTCLVQMWQHTARSEGGVFGPLTSEGH